MTKNAKVYLIAEAGVNHNGSLDMAKRLVECAAKAGADAVKFQTFRAEKLTTGDAPKADYQKKHTELKESQIDMLRKLELDEAAHKVLIECCKDYRIEFLSTPFDIESLELLSYKLNLSKIKIPSGEITNAPLLLSAARTGKPIILSTGMSTLGEVEEALAVLAFGYSDFDNVPLMSNFRRAFASDAGQKSLMQNVVLLHCTTEYPVPFEDVNLRAMDTLKNAFGLPVGLSDHTQGFAIALAAVARGARVIEKHFTIDRSLPGPDHMASLEPSELREMVCGIRQVELALGNGMKVPAGSEQKNQNIVRKSLVALRPIASGEDITSENLGMKRPGNGISPMFYWDWLGKKADRDYQQDERIGR